MNDTTDTIELIDRAEIKDGQAIVAYTRTQAAVAELRQKYQGAKYDLTTTAGDKAARAGRLELVTLRNDLEKKRKQLKAPALEFGKKVDSEAARLTAEIVALEDPIDAQIKADEQRREAERRAKEEAEAARRKVHTDGIAKIAGYVAQATDLSAARIGAGIAFLERMDCAGFEEFTDEACATRDRSIEALRAMQIKAQAREDEAARLEAERVEQARIAAEQAETARQLKAQQDEIARQQAELAEAQARLQREEEARAQRLAQERAEAEAAERQHVAPAEAEQRRQEAPEYTLATAPPWHQTQLPAGTQPAASTVEAFTGQRSMVVPIRPAGPPTLKLGEINKRLGAMGVDANLSAAFLGAIGIEPAGRERSAVMFFEHQFNSICDALIGHIAAAQRQRQQAA